MVVEDLTSTAENYPMEESKSAGDDNSTQYAYTERASIFPYWSIFLIECHGIGKNELHVCREFACGVVFFALYSLLYGMKFSLINVKRGPPHIRICFQDIVDA
jgi:hypothetical protein